jgi:CRP-like cAMP-binding protein
MQIQEVLQKSPQLRSQDDIFFMTMFLHESFPLFDAYEASDLEQVARCLWLKEFNEEELIYREGERADGIYFLHRGTVHIQTAEADTEVKPSNPFGLTALLNQHSQRQDTAQASFDSSCQCLFLPIKEFYQLMYLKEQASRATRLWWFESSFGFTKFWHAQKLEAFNRDLELVSFNKNEELFGQGAEIAFLWILQEGLVQVETALELEDEVQGHERVV